MKKMDGDKDDDGQEKKKKKRNVKKMDELQSRMAQGI